MASTESDKQQSSDAAAALTPVDALTVNLQVLSPSPAVSRPLLFPGTPASTTVKQLKERIRQSLPLQPADENQRLIHRGRAIIREGDTLLDIFGAETLRNPDQQTIHLVIRETADSTSPLGSTAARERSLSPGNTLPGHLRQQLPQSRPVTGPQVPPGFARRNITQPTPTLPTPRGPSPARPPIADQAPGLQGVAAAQHALAHQQALLQHQQFHHQHQNMTQWLTQLQRETMARQLISQNQRNRAQLGMRGIGDPAVPNGAPAPEPSSGRASPAPTHTVVREGWGPNGRTYQVETVIRTAAPAAQQGLSPVDVQNILRGADANHATAAMASAMQRSASGASLHGRPLTQPGVTTPIGMSALGSHPPSRRATPDIGYRFQSAPRQGLEVYILSSPEGPRALLVNNNTSETYYTPMLRSQASRNFHDVGGSVSHEAQHQHPQQHQYQHLYQYLQQRQAHVPVQADHRPQSAASNHQSPQPAQQQQPQPPPQQQPQQQPPQPHQQQHHDQQWAQRDQDWMRQQQPQPAQQQNGAAEIWHPHNQQIGAVPPLMAHIGPHIWTIFRLAFTVWLFTSPGLSWAKWLLMVCLAIFTFVMSTGVLDGLVDRVWQPAARQLENLIRPIDHGNGQQDAQQQGDLDPAQMAARLLAEQRGRETWMVGQMRRLERAGLLFLASIAPGIAERHIANLEAEARAERERREAAARAAAEAEAAAAAAAAEQEANGEAGEESATGNGDEPANTQSAEPRMSEENPHVGEGQHAHPGGNDNTHREPLVAL